MSKRVVLDPDRGLFVDAASNEPWMMRTDLAIGDPLSDWRGDLPCERILLRCGRASDGPDPSRWGQSGWDRFDQEVNEAAQEADERGIELWILPTIDGMLSDAISTASWARRTSSSSTRLLIDPVDWLTESMLKDSEDHLRRISELMVGCPILSGVLLRASELDDPTAAIRAMRAMIEDSDVLCALDDKEFTLLDEA